MYSLCGVPREEILVMAENLKRTSEAIATALTVIMQTSNRKTVDDELWSIAVEVADGKRSLSNAITQSIGPSQAESTPPISTLSFEHRGVEPRRRSPSALVYEPKAELLATRREKAREERVVAVAVLWRDTERKSSIEAYFSTEKEMWIERLGTYPNGHALLRGLYD